MKAFEYPIVCNWLNSLSMRARGDDKYELMRNLQNLSQKVFNAHYDRHLASQGIRHA